MTSQPGKQATAIHILPNISRSEGNETMKFDQFLEYNTRNIFLEKPYIRCAGKLFPDAFKKTKLSISLDQKTKMGLELVSLSHFLHGF